MILRSVFLDMLTREYRGDRVLVVAHQVTVWSSLRYLLDRLDEATSPSIGSATSRTAASRRTSSTCAGRRGGKLVLRVENFTAPLREAGTQVSGRIPDVPVAAKS